MNSEGDHNALEFGISFLLQPQMHAGVAVPLQMLQILTAVTELFRLQQLEREISKHESSADQVREMSAAQLIWRMHA